MIPPLEKYRVLIVDDEPDIHQVTRLAIKRMRVDGKRIELASAHSKAEAIADLKEHTNTAVVLLDVVMETEDAGLQAVQTIRQELGNHAVRVLLRTGQPGVARPGGRLQPEQGYTPAIDAGWLCSR